MKFKLFLLSMLLTGLSNAQDLETWTEITFQSQTRGGNLKEVRITADSVHYRNGNMRSGDLQEVHKCLTKKDKKQLQRILKDLSETKITDLEAPSNKRAFDGAAHSEITIHIRDQKLYHYFDDEQPHEKMFPLLNRILAFREN